MTTIDFVAAQRVAQARLLETAVHDRGPWTIRIADVEADCVRVVCPSRIVFLAFFPPRVWEETGQVAWLRCRGEDMASRLVEVADGEFSMEWSIGPGPSEREPVAP